MKKEIIKPFDLASYKNGAKIKTRDGHEVRIICTDAKNGYYPILGLVAGNGDEHIVFYTLEGKLCRTKSAIRDEDLVIVEEPEFWSDNKDNTFCGFRINNVASIAEVYAHNTNNFYDVFATKKQAKSARAMARISQIMANDIEHFGGAITDDEWEDLTVEKYAICRLNNAISLMCSYLDYRFLAFHKEEQRDLFLDKYRDLVREFLMIG